MKGTQSVCLPVFKGILNTQIEKGLQWSVVEHLILHGFCQRPRTIEEMVEHSSVHHTVVLECAIRLMRAGWLELVHIDGAARFSASTVGRLEVEKESLPAITRRFSRNLHYLIDRIDGGIFPNNGLMLKAAREFGRRTPILMNPRLDRDDLPGYIQLVERLSTISNAVYSDEVIVGCNPHRSSIEDDWYMVLSVGADDIEGLPVTSTAALRSRVLASAAKSDSASHQYFGDAIEPLKELAEIRLHNVEWNPDDLIIGGPAHRDALGSVLRNARHRVVVHSTFLSSKRLESKLEDLIEAAKNDVRVDLLWDMDQGDDKHAQSLTECREMLNKPEFKGLIRVAGISTRSHSKLVFADNGRGEYFCLVGSCNWLSSPFESFELSVRLRGASIVAECLAVFENLTPLDGEDWELRDELIETSLRLRSTPSARGLANVALVLQGDHERLVRKAGQDANERVFVASNKAGNSIETQVLAPLESATREKPLNVSVYYQNERRGSAVDSNIVENLKRRYDRLRINTVEFAHAKLLCWDSDRAVVSSLNWLSKDASDTNPVGECGVYIEYPGVADIITNAYLAEAGVKVSV